MMLERCAEECDLRGNAMFNCLRAEGAVEISRWWRLCETTGIWRISLASPGGGDRPKLVPAPLPGRNSILGLIRWFRFASPPEAIAKSQQALNGLR